MSTTNDDVQQKNDQITNDIQSLQQMEQQLFNSLESNTSITPEEQQQMLEKINQLSNMRVHLYQTLSGINSYYENAMNSSVGTLKGQSSAVSIVENELNKSKKKLELLEEEKNNQIRLVEINTYFGEKYEEHSQLMKIIILTLIPVIAITVLYKKGILPNPVYYGLLILVSAIGAYFFWTRFSSIIRRDNMNYDEYNWFFNPNTAPTTNTTNSASTSDPWASTSLNYGTCIGDACCATGLVYDYSLNQCAIATTTTESFVNQQLRLKASNTNSNNSNSNSKNSNSKNATESFVNTILSKTQQNKYKNDYDLNQPGPFNNIFSV